MALVPKEAVKTAFPDATEIEVVQHSHCAQRISISNGRVKQSWLFCLSDHESTMRDWTVYQGAWKRKKEQ